MGLLLALCIALFSLAHAKDSGDEPALRVPVEFCEQGLLGGAVMAVQVLKPRDPSMPVFLLLPGVNRGLLLQESVPTLLGLNGYGVVTMQFSSHPISVTGLAQDQGPPPVTLETLAAQVDTVRHYLKENYGLTQLIPVSLSYSGAVSVHLKDYPLVVDVVPLTSAAAHNPNFESQRQFMQQTALLNPVIAHRLSRSMVDTAYRSLWREEVDFQIESFGLPESCRTKMVEGMVGLSQAVEGFSWDKCAPASDVRRVFVLAGQEAPALFRHQIQTLVQLKELGHRVSAIVVKDTSHMIFNDTPMTLALVLKAIALSGQANTPDPLLMMVTPSTGEVESLDGEAALAYLKRL